MMMLFSLAFWILCSRPALLMVRSIIWFLLK
jgi:hypothetical protein